MEERSEMQAQNKSHRRSLRRQGDSLGDAEVLMQVEHAGVTSLTF